MIKWPTPYPTGPSHGQPCEPVTLYVIYEPEFVHFSISVGDTKAQETAFEQGEGEVTVWNKTIRRSNNRMLDYYYREQHRLAEAWDAAIRKAQA